MARIWIVPDVLRRVFKAIGKIPDKPKLCLPRIIAGLVTYRIVVIVFIPIILLHFIVIARNKMLLKIVRSHITTDTLRVNIIVVIAWKCSTQNLFGIRILGHPSFFRGVWQ